MTMEVSIALAALSAPITAIILKYWPSKNGKKNGPYVTIREYDLHKIDLGDKLVGLDGRLLDMNTRLQDLTTAVNSHLK